MIQNILLVFLGGGLGSLARLGVSYSVRAVSDTHFPFATLVANILSCLVLALAVGMFGVKMDSDSSIRAFVIVGFCGGFSTFSTFSVETLELFHKGQFLWAAANVLISVTCCIVLLALFVRK